MILRLALCNVPRSVGRKAWRRCFRLTAERADLFGIVEALTPYQKAIYRLLAVALGLRQYGLFKGPNPVFSAPKVWRRTHASHYRLHGRGPWWRRWPGFNERRFATVALYRHRRDKDFPRVAVVNTHWVPRGRKVPAAWRQRARRRSIRLVSRIIERHLDAGHVVVVMGDFNMDEAPDLPDVTWVMGAHHGVDKIGVACPAGWRIKARRGDRFRAPTDHGGGVSAVVEVGRVTSA